MITCRWSYQIKMKNPNGFKKWAQVKKGDSIYINKGREQEFKDCWDAAVEHVFKVAQRVKKRDSWFIGGFLGAVGSELKEQ